MFENIVHAHEFDAWLLHEIGPEEYAKLIEYADLYVRDDGYSDGNDSYTDDELRIFRLN